MYCIILSKNTILATIPFLKW